MPIMILTLLVQIACAVHVVRTNRDKYWLWIIIMAPGFGSAIYVITQMLPDAGSSRAAGQMKAGAVKILDPMREYREAMRAFDMVESIDNRIRLVEALIGLNKWEEAEPHLTQCLMGHGANDPHILMRAAAVKLELGRPDEALAHLDHLQATNKNFQSQQGHLLYARAQEAAGDTEGALETYASLVGYATGEEARVRYATLLGHAGRHGEAKEVLAEVIARGRRATSHYRRDQKAWLQEAQRLYTTH